MDGCTIDGSVNPDIPQSIPTASQPPSTSHQSTGTTKRKVTEMAFSSPSSALPLAEVVTPTSLIRSVSLAASEINVIQSLATQLELYMKSTDSALVNSQIALEQSKVALQQTTMSIAALEEKVDDFFTATTLYRANTNA
ncbi:hypothetical protein BGZ95_006084 [Linnemannia exigua]|uniref:Uncharacterized protein n=1 Tax=Linnemannia exigua TaxID=604196 RepID=A0AAD4D3C0_9FUNG|nr:hypothetical protein BGZ95_006084 [Linnemannia exigua]